MILKKTWSVIRTLLAKKTSSTSIKCILVNGRMLCDKLEIAEHFNEYFTNVAGILDSNIPLSEISPLSYVTPNIQSSFLCYPVRENKVVDIVQNVKNTAVSINEVPVRLLKAVKSVVATPITRLINNSISEGKFPDALKRAKIVSIFKGGN